MSEGKKYYAAFNLSVGAGLNEIRVLIDEVEFAYKMYGEPGTLRLHAVKPKEHVVDGSPLYSFEFLDA